MATISEWPLGSDATDAIPGMLQLTADMSKTQLQLTVNEGRLWESLGMASPTLQIGQISDSDSKTSHDPDILLKMLMERSRVISSMYERRVQSPTKQHYAEVQEILEAMDVPIFKTDGPYEAEGLASSFVLQGYADYVATEDTVICFTAGPLIIVHIAF